MGGAEPDFQVPRLFVNKLRQNQTTARRPKALELDESCERLWAAGRVLPYLMFQN